MNSTCFFKLDDIPVKEIFPGYLAKLIHTANNTFNFLEVKAGNPVPMHHHIHEQTAFVLEGEFELEVNGEKRIMKPGEFAIILPNVPHAGRAITDCKLLDIFSPVREDYRQK